MKPPLHLGTGRFAPPSEGLDGVEHFRGVPLDLDLAPDTADEPGDVTEAFGVWGEKSMYGRTYMGVERATFLIDGAGLVRRVWRKVKVKGHAAEVLDAVRSL